VHLLLQVAFNPSDLYQQELLLFQAVIHSLHIEFLDSGIVIHLIPANAGRLNLLSMPL